MTDKKIPTPPPEPPPKPSRDSRTEFSEGVVEIREATDSARVEIHASNTHPPPADAPPKKER